MINARSYAGRAVNNDHRLVITKLSILPSLLYQHHKKRQDKPIEYSNIHNSDAKEACQTDLRQKLQQNDDEGERPSLQQKWENVVAKIVSSAKDNLGYRKPNQNNRHHDLEIEVMSNQQKELSLQIQRVDMPDQAVDIRTKRN